ncbi:MAG: OmpA family protein, partial [Myxococcota bacterium]|nr:OmpA family protein [Myxococcota bacterium]
NAAIPDSFMGHKSFTVHPKLAFDFVVGRFRVGFNGGYLWRKEQQFYYAEIGPRITYGAATEITFTEKWSGLVELFGSNGFTPDVTSSPLEVDLAAKFKPIPQLAILFGAGAGILGGVGTPFVRAFGGVAWSPALGPDKDDDGVLDSEDECPDEPEDKDGFEDSDGCPDPDNDKDGIPDTKDRCPDDPEDKDGFEDADGCPDPDHDHDGIPNDKDECPEEEEDHDGFQDDDGCPDPDNDGDGILDKKDACPDEAEDFDGFQDKDGCPDEDNDQDGIPDVDDRCPTEKEVLNDFEDEDGCPDKGEELARLEKAEIKITQKIHFKYDSDELTGGSHRTLNVIATVLRKNPKMKIRIEGHTDSKGRSRYNLGLSQRRVDSVKTYLVNKNVEPGRLRAKGYGESKPIETNKTREGRAANRRVEFHILKKR